MSTTAAHDSLVIAKAYYDRIHNEKLTVTEHLDCIKFGTHHLALGRHADPHATLTVQEKSGAVTYTQEFLSAQFLYHQAMHEQALEDEAGCLKSLDTLKQATAYTPTAPYLHRSVAKTFLKLNRRDEAITAAKFALALDPSNMDSRMLLDKIEATPDLGVPEEDPGAGETQLGCGLMIAAPVVMFLLFSLENTTGAMGRLPLMGQSTIFLGLVGLFFFGLHIYRSAERTRYLHKSFQKDFYK